MVTGPKLYYLRIFVQRSKRRALACLQIIDRKTDRSSTIRRCSWLLFATSYLAAQIERVECNNLRSNLQNAQFSWLKTTAPIYTAHSSQPLSLSTAVSQTSLFISFLEGFGSSITSISAYSHVDFEEERNTPRLWHASATNIVLIGNCRNCKGNSSTSVSAN